VFLFRLVLGHMQPVSCLMSTRNFPLGLKVSRARSCSAEVKKTWNFTSTPPICLYIVVPRHRGNITPFGTEKPQLFILCCLNLPASVRSIPLCSENILTTVTSSYSAVQGAAHL